MSLRQASMDNLAEEFSGILVDCSGPASQERIEAAERELGVVFPASYREFLLHFGTGTLGWLDIFGLPSNWIWGDIVMMNELAPVKAPAHCILIARDPRGNFYCLDTSQGNNGWVARLGSDGQKKVLASDFASFLHKVKEGDL